MRDRAAQASQDLVDSDPYQISSKGPAQLDRRFSEPFASRVRLSHPLIALARSLEPDTGFFKRYASPDVPADRSLGILGGQRIGHVAASPPLTVEADQISLEQFKHRSLGPVEAFPDRQIVENVVRPPVRLPDSNWSLVT